MSSGSARRSSRWRGPRQWTDAVEHRRTRARIGNVSGCSTGGFDIASKQRKIEAASKLFRDVQPQLGTSEAVVRIAHGEIRLGRYQEAIDRLEQAGVQPSDPEDTYLRGW